MEQSLALMEKIKKVVVSMPRLPTSFSNGIHLDLLDLKAEGKLSRIHSTILHIFMVVGR